MELRNRDIKYTATRTPYGSNADAAVIKAVLGITEDDSFDKIPASLWDELNKNYRKGVRIAMLKRFFNKIAKLGIWYVGANIAIAIAIGVAMLLGVDVFAWYTGLLGGRI